MSRILFGFDDEQSLDVSAIVSAEAFGEPLLADAVDPGGIASAESVGAPTVSASPAVRPTPYVPAESGGPFFFFGTGGGGGAAWSRYGLLKHDAEHLGLGAETFEWPKAAEKDEARRALRKVASWMHPDVIARLHPEAREQIEERFTDLTAAYAALERREHATRGRRLATATTDPVWDEFLRNLKPQPGALVPEELAARISEIAEAVNEPETVETALAAPRKKKRRKKKTSSASLQLYPLPAQPTYVVDARPLVSGTTLATAVFLATSFGAGWFLAQTFDHLVRG